MTQTQDLKRLQTQQKQIKEELRLLNLERARLHAKLEDVVRRTEALTKGKLVITEHAILRYLQRVQGLDLDQVKDLLVGTDHKQLSLPDGLYPVDAHKIRVKDGKVLTVLADEEQQD